MKLNQILKVVAAIYVGAANTLVAHAQVDATGEAIVKSTLKRMGDSTPIAAEGTATTSAGTVAGWFKLMAGQKRTLRNTADNMYTEIQISQDGTKGWAKSYTWAKKGRYYESNYVELNYPQFNAYMPVANAYVSIAFNAGHLYYSMALTSQGCSGGQNAIPIDVYLAYSTHEFNAPYTCSWYE